MPHFTREAIEAYLNKQGTSPQDAGTLEMIVIRPQHGERQVLERAVLDVQAGIIGDNWQTRGSRHTPDGEAHPGMQIAIMNSRILQSLTQNRDLWPLAGDQLMIDLDLSTANLATGQRLSIGSAILEITDVRHTGCKKFTERYGHDAIRFVNSREGQLARRRGIYARVIQGGVIKVKDVVQKVHVEPT